MARTIYIATSTTLSSAESFLYTVHPTTGVRTLVGSLGADKCRDIRGLTSFPDGRLIALSGHTSDWNKVWFVDSQTGAATASTYNISIGGREWEGCWYHDGWLFAHNATQGNVQRIDLATGAAGPYAWPVSDVGFPAGGFSTGDKHYVGDGSTIWEITGTGSSGLTRQSWSLGTTRVSGMTWDGPTNSIYATGADSENLINFDLDTETLSTVVIQDDGTFIHYHGIHVVNIVDISAEFTSAYTDEVTVAVQEPIADVSAEVTLAYTDEVEISKVEPVSLPIQFIFSYTDEVSIELERLPLELPIQFIYSYTDEVAIQLEDPQLELVVEEDVSFLDQVVLTIIDTLSIAAQHIVGYTDEVPVFVGDNLEIGSEATVAYADEVEVSFLPNWSGSGTAADPWIIPGNTILPELVVDDISSFLLGGLANTYFRVPSLPAIGFYSCTFILDQDPVGGTWRVAGSGLSAGGGSAAVAYLLPRSHTTGAQYDIEISRTVELGPISFRMDGPQIDIRAEDTIEVTEEVWVATRADLLLSVEDTVGVTDQVRGDSVPPWTGEGTSSDPYIVPGNTILPNLPPTGTLDWAPFLRGGLEDTYFRMTSLPANGDYFISFISVAAGVTRQRSDFSPTSTNLVAYASTVEPGRYNLSGELVVGADETIRLQRTIELDHLQVTIFGPVIELEAEPLIGVVIDDVVVIVADVIDISVEATIGVTPEVTVEIAFLLLSGESVLGVTNEVVVGFIDPLGVRAESVVGVTDEVAISLQQPPLDVSAEFVEGVIVEVTAIVETPLPPLAFGAVDSFFVRDQLSIGQATAITTVRSTNPDGSVTVQNFFELAAVDDDINAGGVASVQLEGLAEDPAPTVTPTPPVDPDNTPVSTDEWPKFLYRQARGFGLTLVDNKIRYTAGGAKPVERARSSVVAHTQVWHMLLTEDELEDLIEYYDETGQGSTGVVLRDDVTDEDREYRIRAINRVSKQTPTRYKVDMTVESLVYQ